MKLATYQDGSRDGQLVVVSRDLRAAHFATGIASRMQQVLDDWAFMAPQLQDLSHQLNSGKAPHAFAFDPQQCMAPLPRAYHWAHGGAYPSHAALLQAAAGSDAPTGSATEPAMEYGGSDAFSGACEDIVVPSAAMGIDFGAQLAVVTGDVPLGTPADQALEGIRLVMLANAVCLRQLRAHEQSRGASPYQSMPVTAFSPVAVTRDELGESWQGGRLHQTLQSSWNGRKVGLCELGEDMAFHFGQLLAHLCKTRALRAGSVVGSGVVGHVGVDSGRGKTRRTDWPKGYHCIAEKRAMEQLQDGAAQTGYLQFGDSVRIEVKNKEGHSVFGAIDQTVVSPQGDGL